MSEAFVELVVGYVLDSDTEVVELLPLLVLAYLMHGLRKLSALVTSLHAELGRVEGALKERIEIEKHLRGRP